MKVIPAIDIIDGKCVRLTQGNYSRCKHYAADPVAMAEVFEDAGATRLHVVDLDGAKAAGVVNMEVLVKICTRTHLSVDFGGGIKTEEDIRRVFEAGADYACVGSIAQTDPEETMQWIERFGGEKIIVGADVWNNKVCIHGWKKVTDTSIYELINRYEKKSCHLMCTDITRDGMLNGPAVGLYRDLLARYPGLPLIASGGVGSYEDLKSLSDAGVEAVIVGKALYEQKIDLGKLQGK